MKDSTYEFGRGLLAGFLIATALGLSLWGIVS